MPNVYMSINSCGVDTKKFYGDVGFTMSDVSKETGISRAALSRIPVHQAAVETAKIALKYMECENRIRYLECIHRLQKEMEQAWEQYQRGEEALKECREMYGIERNYPEVEKI